MQLTLRNVPKRTEDALRQRAAEEGKSLNQVACDAIAAGLGVSGELPKLRDITDIAGTWVEDPEFDRAIAEMRRIDPEMWK